MTENCCENRTKKKKNGVRQADQYLDTLGMVLVDGCPMDVIIKWQIPGHIPSVTILKGYSYWTVYLRLIKFFND